MRRKFLPVPSDPVFVRAHCGLGHSWVTTATIRQSWPLGSRHPIQHETLQSDRCPYCSGPYLHFQDTRHGAIA